MSNAVSEAVLAGLEKGITDNGELAAMVRQVVPGAQTTASSVASIKSRLRKDGHDVPSSRPNGRGVNLDGVDFDQFKRPEDLPDADPLESDEDAAKRIALRYDAMERMMARVVAKKVPSLIVSGPPGLGKSYTIEQALERAFPDGAEKADSYDEQAVDPDADDGDESQGALSTGELHYDVVSGSISAVGLYQALWYTRNGGILVLDDCDDVFRDETALNILKAALDSKKVRTISWRKEAKWLEDYGIADRFAYAGHVVFLSNIDFELEIAKGKRDSEHFKALIDRSLYLCLTLRTARDFMIRIRQVSEGENGMLAQQFDCDADAAKEVLDFIEENRKRFYNLSLRLVGQVAVCRMSDPERWKEDVEATKMRTV